MSQVAHDRHLRNSSETMNHLISYMKDVVEGRDNLVPFARWFHDHEQELQQLCSRGAYLRLKSKPIPEFKKILTEQSVSFVESSEANVPKMPKDYSWVQTEWLTEEIIPYQQSPLKLVGEGSLYLDELLHMIHVKETGDTLWRFSSPNETWENKMGCAGIALLRGESVIYAIVTMRN